MPLEHSDTQAATEANFHELRRGKTFKKSARKYGRKRARKQMIAIVMRNKRESKRKRVARKR